MSLIELKAYIGTEYKDNNGYSLVHNHNDVLRLILEEFENCTVHPYCLGQWKYTHETTLVVELIIEPEQINEVIEKLNNIKDELRQEEILVTRKDINTISI